MINSTLKVGWNCLHKRDCLSYEVGQKGKESQLLGAAATTSRNKE